MVMYLGGITKYTIIAWILANWNKWCAWGEWELKDGTHLLRLSTNILYHHVVASLSWRSPKSKKVKDVRKPNARWWQLLQPGWHFHLPFLAKLKKFETHKRQRSVLVHAWPCRCEALIWNNSLVSAQRTFYAKYRPFKDTNKYLYSREKMV